jgi:hypothetical protein
MRTLIALLFAPVVALACEPPAKDRVVDFTIAGKYAGNVSIVAGTPSSPGLADARLDTVSYGDANLVLGPNCTLPATLIGSQSATDGVTRGGRSNVVDKTTTVFEYDVAPNPHATCVLDTSQGAVTFEIETGLFQFSSNRALVGTVGGYISTSPLLGGLGGTAPSPAGYVTYRFEGRMDPITP